MSAYYRHVLARNGHIVKVSELDETDPTTTFGTYHGTLDGVQYSYQSGINSRSCATGTTAKSDALVTAEAKYIALFKRVRGEQIAFYRNYEDALPDYLFWDQENDAMRDRFVAQGLLPSEVQFVFAELGIDALVLR
jgi:hypothetical protein